ncbi:MAG: hypothetical protein EA418_09280 [Wenzhouxiangellaceae bacterium]|nr:MAG: hypothetical protein EA418_09280 [Wenzhouxiangellaceae bacterium]
MQILVTVLALLVLVPAGLAGIRASLGEIHGLSGELTQALTDMWIASEPLWAWCQVLGCGVGGLVLLVMAVMIAWRGLQSFGLNNTNT